MPAFTRIVIRDPTKVCVSYFSQVWFLGCVLIAVLGEFEGGELIVEGTNAGAQTGISIAYLLFE